MKKTIEEIANAIADATGVSRDLATLVVDDLKRADLVNDDDASDSAAKVLIAFAGAMEVQAADRSIARYWDLPYEGIIHSDLSGGLYKNRWQNLELETDHPFGPSLAALINTAVEADVMEARLSGVIISCGPGLTRAIFETVWENETDRFACQYHYSTAPAGGGRLPDDAPRARMEKSVTFPGIIFTVLREVIGGRTDLPALTPLPPETAAEWRGAFKALDQGKDI